MYCSNIDQRINKSLILFVWCGKVVMEREKMIDELSLIGRNQRSKEASHTTQYPDAVQCKLLCNKCCLKWVSVHCIDIAKR